MARDLVADREDGAEEAMRCSETRRVRRMAVCREHTHGRVVEVELGEIVVVTRRPRCVTIAVTVTHWGTA